MNDCTFVARNMNSTTKKRQCTELYMLVRVGVCSNTKEMAASTAVSTMKSATNELIGTSIDVGRC